MRSREDIFKNERIRPPRYKNSKFKTLGPKDLEFNKISSRGRLSGPQGALAGPF